MRKRKIHDNFSTICFIVFAIPSALIIAISFQIPEPNAILGVLLADFVTVEFLENLGLSFYDVSYAIFPLNPPYIFYLIKWFFFSSP